MVFEMCERTDSLKDILITILHTPFGVNNIFDEISRITSREVVIQIIKRKFIPVLVHVTLSPDVCPLNVIEKCKQFF